MAVVSKAYLLEAGVHFGHQVKRWNPKMKEYIFTSRDDIYIIDLEKTVELIEEAYTELFKACGNGGKVLFVGTKKQAQEACQEEAARCGGYYVTERWLGGLLTNFKTIRDRVSRMTEIEEMEKTGKFELLPKKEVAKIQKEYNKLNKLLSGVREMNRLPQAVIVVDPRVEYNATREARILGIPVFGIVDTNSEPDYVDFVIPGNDDAVRAVKVVLGVLANAVCEANNLPLVDYVTEQEFVRPKKESEAEIEDTTVNVIEKIVEVPEEETVKVVKEVKKVKKETKKSSEKAKTIDISTLKLAELKTLAKEKGIKGYSTMKKDDLIASLK